MGVSINIRRRWTMLWNCSALNSVLAIHCFRDIHCVAWIPLFLNNWRAVKMRDFLSNKEQLDSLLLMHESISSWFQQSASVPSGLCEEQPGTPWLYWPCIKGRKTDFPSCYGTLFQWRIFAISTGLAPGLGQGMEESSDIAWTDGSSSQDVGYANGKFFHTSSHLSKERKHSTVLRLISGASSERNP